jgi:hypothetical protein
MSHLLFNQIIPMTTISPAEQDMLDQTSIIQMQQHILDLSKIHMWKTQKAFIKAQELLDPDA